VPTTDADARALVQRAQAGDADAATALYQRHGSAIFRYFLFRVGDQAAAEDLTSEVFLQMVRALPRYQERGAPFAAWLFRIAHARLVDYHRLAARRPSAALRETTPDRAPGPDVQAADRDDLRQLNSALATLTEEQQMVIQLRFIEEQSLEATARVLGKSVNAIKSMQHRAMQHLAKELTQ
jgi:RNA polymerase sigma-70 factor (ECF subfamily)